MKKILSLFIIFLFIFTLSGCSGKARMSKRVERMIQKSYASMVMKYKDVDLDYKEIKVTYLGKYHKVHCAIIIGDNWIKHNRNSSEAFYGDNVINVNGVIYPFMLGSSTISVYYKNEHYALINAYNEGIILGEDIPKLYEYCMKHVELFKLYFGTFNFQKNGGVEEIYIV